MTNRPSVHRPTLGAPADPRRTGRPSAHRPTLGEPADPRCTGRPSAHRPTLGAPADPWRTGRPSVHRPTSAHRPTLGAPADPRCTSQPSAHQPTLGAPADPRRTGRPSAHWPTLRLTGDEAHFADHHPAVIEVQLDADVHRDSVRHRHDDGPRPLHEVVAREREHHLAAAAARPEVPAADAEEDARLAEHAHAAPELVAAVQPDGAEVAHVREPEDECNGRGARVRGVVAPPDPVGAARVPVADGAVHQLAEPAGQHAPPLRPVVREVAQVELRAAARVALRHAVRDGVRCNTAATAALTSARAEPHGRNDNKLNLIFVHNNYNDGCFELLLFLT